MLVRTVLSLGTKEGLSRYLRDGALRAYRVLTEVPYWSSRLVRVAGAVFQIVDFEVASSSVILTGPE